MAADQRRCTGVALPHGRRSHLRIPGDAPAVARRRRLAHRPTRRHRRHPTPGGCRASRARLRRAQPTPPHLRQRRPHRHPRQRRSAPAQLGRRPQSVQVAVGRGAHRPRSHRQSRRRRNRQRCGPRAGWRRPADLVGDQQGTAGPAHCAAPPAQLPPARLRRGAQPVRCHSRQRDRRRSSPSARHAPQRRGGRRARPATHPAQAVGRGDGRRAPRRPARRTARERAVAHHRRPRPRTSRRRARGDGVRRRGRPVGRDARRAAHPRARRDGR